MSSVQRGPFARWLLQIGRYRLSDVLGEGLVPSPPGPDDSYGDLADTYDPEGFFAKVRAVIRVFHRGWSPAEQQRLRWYYWPDYAWDLPVELRAVIRPVPRGLGPLDPLDEEGQQELRMALQVPPSSPTATPSPAVCVYLAERLRSPGGTFAGVARATMGTTMGLFHLCEKFRARVAAEVRR